MERRQWLPHKRDRDETHVGEDQVDEAVEDRERADRVNGEAPLEDSQRNHSLISHIALPKDECSSQHGCKNEALVRVNQRAFHECDTLGIHTTMTSAPFHAFSFPPHWRPRTRLVTAPRLSAAPIQSKAAVRRNMVLEERS